MSTTKTHVTHEMLSQAAQEKGAVPLTANDFARMMEHGQVFVKLADNSKYTRYARVTVEDGQLIFGSFITTSVDDKGTRYAYYFNPHGVFKPTAHHNLRIFNGINMPAIANEYQGESWNLNRRPNMSVAELKALHAPGTSAVLSRKHMDQAAIDYFAIEVRIMSGVTSHEAYNTFALNVDLMALLKDRIHEYTVAVDVRLKADGVVPFPDRYAGDPVRNFLENFGIEIGDILATKKYVPTEEELNVLFDSVLLKHNLPVV